MSYKSILGQWALATALGITATAAQAASAIISSTSSVSHSTRSLLNSNGNPAAGVVYKLTPVQELNVRMNSSANQPILNSCFQRLAINRMHPAQILPADVQKMIDCVDQEVMTRFLKNPDKNARGVATILKTQNVDPAARWVTEEPSFARKLADACRKKATDNVRDFSTCALGEQKKQAYVNGLIALGIFAPLLLVTLIAGGAIDTRKVFGHSKKKGSSLDPG